MELLIIRHGQSMGEVDERHEGRADSATRYGNPGVGSPGTRQDVPRAANSRPVHRFGMRRGSARCQPADRSLHGHRHQPRGDPDCERKRPDP